MGQKIRGRQEWLHIFLGAGVLLGIYSCGKLMPRSGNSYLRDWLSALAQVQCEDAVRLALRPFVKVELSNVRTLSQVEDRESMTYRVSLSADVPNVNGVTARVNYHCVVLANKATRVATVIKVDRSAEVL